MKEEKKGEKKEIIILDTGIKTEDIITLGVCCNGPYIPVRG